MNIANYELLTYPRACHCLCQSCKLFAHFSGMACLLSPSPSFLLNLSLESRATLISSPHCIPPSFPSRKGTCSLTLSAPSISSLAAGHNKYIDDKSPGMRKKGGPYDTMIKVQATMIKLQNMLFANGQPLEEKIKEYSGKIVTNH